MSTTRFALQTPEELRALAPFVKSGTVERVAAVWSATRRKNGGTCLWDGKIGVSFRTEGRKRIATVFRITSGDEANEIASLKYTPALNWCIGNLAVL